MLKDSNNTDLDELLDDIQKAYRIERRLATTENLISRDKAKAKLETLIKIAEIKARIDGLNSIFGMRPIIGMDRIPSKDLADLVDSIKNSIGELTRELNNLEQVKDSHAE